MHVDVRARARLRLNPPTSLPGALLQPLGLGPHPPVAVTTTSVRTWGLEFVEREGGATPESPCIRDLRTL